MFNDTKISSTLSPLSIFFLSLSFMNHITPMCYFDFDVFLRSCCGFLSFLFFTAVSLVGVYCSLGIGPSYSRSEVELAPTSAVTGFRHLALRKCRPERVVRVMSRGWFSGSIYPLLLLLFIRILFYPESPFIELNLQIYS